LYGVYLVDDEPLVLEDMKKSIKWHEYNLTVVGANINPIAAKAEILSLRPDVVFTDVKMHQCSGLDLIASLREESLDCEFVVISAHERFDYARQLLLHRGFDYLIKPVNEEQYDGLFNQLLTRLNSSRPQPSATSSDDLNHIIAYLNSDLTKKHSLKEIAASFNISVGHICALFSKHLCTTFSAYLTNIRMEAAAKMLLSTNELVKNIAIECGYEDYFYFCRVFKGHFSKTPTEYRGGK
jgi:YesN/AraC family two-component response regulator